MTKHMLKAMHDALTEPRPAELDRLPRSRSQSSGDGPVSTTAGLPRVHDAWPTLPPDRLTVFVCCDGPYLERHGLAFARSLDSNAPNMHLHIHLINPEARIRFGLSTLDLPGTSLSHSTEYVDFSRRSPDYARTYCASIRFVRQFELLCHSGRAVFSFDVDALVRGSLEPLRRTLIDGAYDCAVHTRLGARKRQEKFLASAFYVRPTPAGRRFAGDIAARIASALLHGDAAWYMDQIAFYDSYRAQRRAEPPLRLYHLPKALSDWEFGKRSVLWVAKGRRKEESAVFVAHQSAYRTPEERRARLPTVSVARPRVGIVLPRLDLPFSKPRGLKGALSLLKGPDAGNRHLRQYWRRFAGLLGDAFRDRSCEVVPVSAPLWQVTTDFVEALDVDLAFIPHKQRFHLPGLRRPAQFYMQQACPWLFSVDPLGWSGASAAYPCDYGAGDPAGGTFERYRERIVGGNDSKFGQPARRSRQDLVAHGEIPDRPYIFLPCQRPTDQTIRLFCDHEPVDVVRVVADWARRRGIPLVLKPHPTNPASARPFRRAAQGPGIHWSTASVHDLIAHSAGVYVINSGVGFEALLHDKPVVTFGRAEYDAVTIHGELDTLDRSWEAVACADFARLRSDYRRFVDWYCRLYCVDLSEPAVGKQRLAGIVEDSVATQNANAEVNGREGQWTATA